MQVKLRVLRGASAGKEVPIRGPQFLIGRSDECHLRVNSEAISRRHCVLTVGKSDVSIQDLGSKNGTYVNGNRIDGTQSLGMGDQLRVGSLEFLVSVQQTASRPEPVSQPASGGGEKKDEIAGMIGDWLEEGNEAERQDRVDDPETREFKMDETDRVKLEEKTVAEPGANHQKKARARRSRSHPRRVYPRRTRRRTRKRPPPGCCGSSSTVADAWRCLRLPQGALNTAGVATEDALCPASFSGWSTNVSRTISLPSCSWSIVSGAPSSACAIACWASGKMPRTWRRKRSCVS